MSAEIAIQRRVAARGIPAPGSLRKWAAAALGKARGEVTIRIVGAAESRALNREWRGKDKPTNVLSFEGDSPSIGDLVICAPVVAREAREQRKSATAHWAHMVVHGCLHLLGYDHLKAREAETMESREVALLRTLGFPDPYQ